MHVGNDFFLSGHRPPINEPLFLTFVFCCEGSARWKRIFFLRPSITDPFFFSPFVLHQAMKDDGVTAGLIAHNAAIGACDKGGEWSLALSVLKDMRTAEVRPDAISYAGAIR